MTGTSTQSAQSLQETYDSLKCILDDESTFAQVVDQVFGSMDLDHDGKLIPRELQNFILRVCGEMGIKDPPNHVQVAHVFKHLDLNNDQSVSKDELAVFLRHLLSEQMKHAAEALRIKQAAQAH